MNTSAPVGTSVIRPRSVERLVAGQATSDGAGVMLTRVLTQNLKRRPDPFLMLDALGTDRPGGYIGGFPDHPHRGSRPSPTCSTAACATAIRPATRACCPAAACSA